MDVQAKLANIPKNARQVGLMWFDEAVAEQVQTKQRIVVCTSAGSDKLAMLAVDRHNSDAPKLTWA
jgi:hypothetical protein